MMNKKTDVLVIGAGLSGLTAAAKAAEKGKKVTVIAKGMGAITLSSGCIDFWGYKLNQPDVHCLNPLNEIKQLVSVKPKHPYNKVQDVLEESISYFLDLCRQNELPYSTNNGKNWLLPTALGTVRPTYLAPDSMAVTSLNEYEKVLVVGFKELKDFYPQVTITNLKNNADLKPGCILDTAMVTLIDSELTPNNLAFKLEKEDIAIKISEQIKQQIIPNTVVLFPPVLGELNTAKVISKLKNSLNCPVYEIANIPPALPGQRLQKVLINCLKSKGVEVIMNCTVTNAKVEGKKCLNVCAEAAGKKIHITAESFILATGSFLGGGLDAEPTAVRESIFNLPVKTGKDFSQKEFLSLQGHEFNTFGIEANDRLQPLDAKGDVLLENVMVTGANLAGANYPIEKCGSGIALTTGYKAGKLA